ncbi:MAG: hypothetical protein KF824_04215 [Fimbriimonadaceae bacterium]|nr:MAG: hypothetical protein KF824_04215 [Fimbriimonadaceae bacterium]
MKYWKAILGLIAVGGFGYLAFSMRNNDGKLPWEAAEKVVQTQKITLPAESQVECLLLEGLDAGGSKVGQEVTLGVLKDVKAGGKTVIPMGTKVIAEISRSRGASLLNAISNTPARLEMTLKHVVLSDGREIPVRANEGKEIYIFTQENTADRIDSAKIDNLWNDPEARGSLLKIAEGAITGKGLEEQQKQIKNLADRLGLEHTSELASEPGKSVQGLDFISALDMMRKGDTGSLDGVQAVLAAQAVGELADLTSSIDHKVRGIFKGRTIRATIGTPVLLYTAKAESFEFPK